MDGKVIVELTTAEALMLQTVLGTLAMHKDKEETEGGEKKKSSFPADIMKISLKVTTGILQSFMEENS